MGLHCKPRDVFVEQTVARLASVVTVAGAAVADEGVGPVLATPIMRWLNGIDGPVDQFNQTVVIQAPAGVTQADVEAVLQALVDRHPMLRLLVADDDDGGWTLLVPEQGAVDARDCLRTVPALSAEAMVAARERLCPAAGVMLSALWATSSRQLVLIIHHLAVDGVSWRILLEDINVAWAQRHGGQPIELPAGGTSFAGWARLLGERARAAAVVEQADLWQRVLTTPALLAPPSDADTLASARHSSVTLDVELTRQVLGDVPAAYHAGVQDVLLIALTLAIAETFGTGTAPIGIDVEGHGRAEELADHVDLSRTVGWFTTKYPVALAPVAGAGLDATIKAVKEQLRALPDGLTYGLLRHLNPDVQLSGAEPTIGFNYLGRLGVSSAERSDGLWLISEEGLALTGVAAAVPMPLSHALELNAVTLDDEAGPRMQANWTWAASVLDDDRVERLSRAWRDALADICAHVRSGGRGLTPSDVLPARLSQDELDDLDRAGELADVLPLTPLQHGLLFHAAHARPGDETYAVQLEFALAGPLDAERLGAAFQQVVARHPHLAARFRHHLEQPVQLIPTDPSAPWSYVEHSGDLRGLSAAERVAVCVLDDRPVIRAALVRTAPEHHRLMLTFHHIVADGWSLPVLVGELFAAYEGHRLPVAGSLRRYVTWLADRDVEAARDAWRAALEHRAVRAPRARRVRR